MRPGPGVLAEAGRAFTRRPVSVFAAAALALLPAHLLAGAVAYVVAQGMKAQAPAGAESAAADRSAPEPAAKVHVNPEASADERRDVLREAAGSRPARPLPVRFDRGIIGQALSFAVLFAGLLFAQAALVPLAFGCAGAAGAWAVVAARFGAVCAATAAGAVLVAGGALVLVAPGLLFAIAFLFAAPTALLEPLSGFAALQRSVRLLRSVWPEVAALVALSVGAEVGLHEVLFRALAPQGPIGSATLDAAIGTIVLPFPLLVSAVLYLRARSVVDRAPIDELRQYMRRICAPG